ncbi:putative leucine-rich repeat domain superfamily [Helianthus debilis subsp. tardiflorus]
MKSTDNCTNRSLCQYPTKIFIMECDALSSLIPWYAAGQMKKLQELRIYKCKRMMEVFESESSSNNVDEGGARVVGGPPLKNVTVVGLPQLSNLESLLINHCENLPHILTFSTLESLMQLKELKVIGCKAMQVIVKEEKETSSKRVVFPHLETLILDKLPKLKGFFLGMNDFRWPSLVIVKISECPQLMMFTSGQSTTPKLKYIETCFGKYAPECGLNFHETIGQAYLIRGCNLKQTRCVYFLLFADHIPSFFRAYYFKRDCKNIEVVVKEEEEKCDAKVNDIILPRLNSLKLGKLPSFKGFCLGKEAFPLPKLETLQIKECRAVTDFTKGHVSTHELKVIDTSFGFCYVKTDINSLVKTKQEEVLLFFSLILFLKRPILITT